MLSALKVIFLDFDGVLNSHQFFAQRGREVCGDDDALDAAAVARLNEIIERTGAKVVISSSWRIEHSLERIVEILGAHGFAGEVVGMTPVLSGSRGREISAWLSENRGVKSYVVLDDATDMDGVARRHLRTTMEVGLLDEHIDVACVVLQRRRWRFW